MLPRRHRLNRPDQFRAVQRSGARSGGRHVVVGISAVTPSPEVSEASVGIAQPSRVGFVVGRSVGSAVVRNKVARRFRAHLARRLPDLPDGLDIVVRALPSAALADSAELVADIDRSLDKALTKARARVGHRPGTVAGVVP